MWGVLGFGYFDNGEKMEIFFIIKFLFFVNFLGEMVMCKILMEKCWIFFYVGFSCYKMRFVSFGLDIYLVFDIIILLYNDVFRKFILIDEFFNG